MISFPANKFEYRASRRNLSCSIPISVQRLYMSNPPSAFGPCRIAVGILLLKCIFWSMDANTPDWIFCNSCAEAIVVVSEAVSRGECSFVAKLFALYWRCWSWETFFPVGDRKTSSVRMASLGSFLVIVASRFRCVLSSDALSVIDGSVSSSYLA